jgi:hypothetical protein
MSRTSLKIQSLSIRLSRSLGSLRRDLVALARLVGTAPAAGLSGVVAGAAPRRRRRLTAGDRARLRVQGEYLGLVRHLSAKDRGRVKAVRAKSGYPAAIKMARRLTRG